jgi:hypothetical protein
MLFENIEQFKKAKNALIESSGDINLAYTKIKEYPEFYKLTEGDIISSLAELKEGLGEKILNYIGGAFGGDIAELKTVLTQMKEQELKFNREELEIYNEFYSILQDQKNIDKNNPDYQEKIKELSQDRNSLNTRMKELTKSHNEIFNALEEKVKGLVKDNSRKKRYFNAQRATDVLETKNDRYEKIKAVTGRSSKRSTDLEEFFGVSPEKAKMDAQKAEEKAKKSVGTLNQGKANSTSTIAAKYTEEPEKTLGSRFENIQNGAGKFYSKKKDIEKLHSDIEDLYSSTDYANYPEEKKININDIYLGAEKFLDALTKEEMKIK